LYSDTIRVFLLSEISNDHRIPSQRHCSGFKRGLWLFGGIVFGGIKSVIDSEKVNHSDYIIEWFSYTLCSAQI